MLPVSSTSARPHHEGSPYNYVPTFYVAIVFIVLFAISTRTFKLKFISFSQLNVFAVAHAAQSIYYRMKWLIPTACFCGALEVAGWSGRLWSHFSPYLDSPFQLQ